ncbi:MAG: glycosyltransferase [Paludibacteraceae bacterium]|nr:glycosyltransferase [Paludibacteraceae bacterium]
MKIVVLGTAYPYRGGLAAFNERMAGQWQAEGHTVRVETFTLQYPDFLFPGKTQYSESPAPQGMKIVRSIHSVNPFNWLRVGRRLRREAPDLVVVKFWHPFMAPCLGTIARMVRRNGHTRVISILDNVIPHERRWTDRLLVRWFVGSVDAFVAMSQSVQDDLRMFDRVKPCGLCPHPLYDHYGTPVPRDAAARELQLPADARYLLFFGFIRDYKGLDILLRAWADPRLRQTDARLLVAGEFYNNSEEYFRLEKELGLQGRVIWHTEFIPDERVRLYFSLADLVVQPYKTATQSGVTQIAYHFAKPMLVTRVGGLAEGVPDGSVGYVTPPEPEAVADALSDFLLHRSPDAFAAGLAEEKAKYSWERMTETILHLYNRVNTFYEK